MASYKTISGKRISETFRDHTEREVADALGKALYHEASGIIAQSQPLVPVETGALRASPFVKDPERDGTVIEVAFGYGGPAAKINPKTGESTDAYAIFVHENLEAHHPVGQAKYLEQPFDAAKSGQAGRIVDHMRGTLGGGGSEPSETQSPESVV